MAWGLVIAGVAVVIAWRRERVDRSAVAMLLVATAAVLVYTYRTLGA